MSGIFIINSVTNIKGTPGIMTGLFANLPGSAANGTVYLSIDTQQVLSYDITIPSWVVLGTGAGSSQNLQQVCIVGEITDTNIRVLTPAGNTKEISISGNDGIDNRSAKLLSDQGEDSGYLQLINKQGFIGTVINDLSGSNDAFRFPDKLGAGGTFAMTSDISNFLQYFPATTNIANITGSPTDNGCYYIQQGSPGGKSAFTVFLNLAITCTGAATLTRLDITLPVGTGGGGTLCLCSGVAGTNGPGSLQRVVNGIDNGGGLTLNFISGFAAQTLQLFATVFYVV